MGFIEPGGDSIFGLRPVRCLAYIPWLAWQVAKSNADVALRILAPSKGISPRVLRVPSSQRTTRTPSPSRRAPSPSTSAKTRSPCTRSRERAPRGSRAARWGIARAPWSARADVRRRAPRHPRYHGARARPRAARADHLRPHPRAQQLRHEDRAHHRRVRILHRPPGLPRHRDRLRAHQLRRHHRGVEVLRVRRSGRVAASSVDSGWCASRISSRACTRRA